MAIDDKEWGKFTEKIDRMHKDILETKEKVEKGFDGMNKRVRKLEVWKGYMMGVGSLLVIAVSLFMKYVL